MEKCSMADKYKPMKLFRLLPESVYINISTPYKFDKYLANAYEHPGKESKITFQIIK